MNFRLLAMFRSLFGLFLVAGTSADSNCTFQPVAIPIKNVPLSNGASLRGYPIAVGNPAQMLSFMLDMINNNSYIFQTTASCTGYTYSADQCITYRGDLFDEIKSSTWESKDGASTAGAFPSDSTPLLTTSIWGTDTLILTDNVSIPSLALGVETDNYYTQYHPQHILGVGPSSTVLSALQSAKVIASNTFSMFWGLNGDVSAAQMDGTLVLGGIDRAKIYGDSDTNVTLPIQYGSYVGCPYGTVVTITNIALNFPNGTVSELLHNPAQACVEPDMPLLMDMAYDVFQLFTQYTGTNQIGRSTGINFWGATYDPKAVYPGDMTITLATGSTTAPIDFRIPNNVMVNPDLIIGADSQVAFNTSVAELLVNPLLPPNDIDMMKLGRPFLGAAYLLMDYDAFTFTIWKANQTDDANIMPILNKAAAESCAAKSSNAPGAPSAIVASPTKTMGISTAAIAGIAIGGLLGLSALAIGIFWLMKKRQRRGENVLLMRESGESTQPVYYEKTEYRAELPNEVASPLLYEAPNSQKVQVPFELEGSSSHLHEI